MHTVQVDRLRSFFYNIDCEVLKCDVTLFVTPRNFISLLNILTLNYAPTYIVVLKPLCISSIPASSLGIFLSIIPRLFSVKHLTRSYQTSFNYCTILCLNVL